MKRAGGGLREPPHRSTSREFFNGRLDGDEKPTIVVGNRMSQKTERLNGGITRRSALKAGVAVSSGFAFGGAAIGTVRGEIAKSENVIPVHHFVRDHKDDEPSPKPDDNDEIVERREGNPVDEGTVADEHDGHWLSWGEFSDITGEIKVECVDGGTSVKLEVDGLVPGGLHTGWNLVFEEPGFNDTRNLAEAFENLTGVGPLGADDGSESVFRADENGRGELEATTPGGELGTRGTIKDCALDEFEWHVVGDLKLDGETYGSSPGPAGKHVEQFAFVFGGEE